MAKTKRTDDKNSGGWQEAEDNTLRVAMNWPFLKKLEWLEDAQKLADLFKSPRRSSSFIHERP